MQYGYQMFLPERDFSSMPEGDSQKAISFSERQRAREIFANTHFPAIFSERGEYIGDGIRTLLTGDMSDPAIPENLEGQRQYFIHEFEKNNPFFDYEVALYAFEPVDVFSETESKPPQSSEWCFNQLLDIFINKRNKIDAAYPLDNPERMAMRLAAKLDIYSYTWKSVMPMFGYSGAYGPYAAYTLKLLDTIIPSPQNLTEMSQEELEITSLWNRGRTIAEDMVVDRIIEVVSNELLCLDIESGGFYARQQVDLHLAAAIACEGFANARALWEADRVAVAEGAPGADHLRRLHFHDLEDAGSLFEGIDCDGIPQSVVQDEVLRFQTSCLERLRREFGQSDAAWTNYFGLGDVDERYLAS